MATGDAFPSERAQRLLKMLVERYISDGQPVGSRALARFSGLELSPASIKKQLGAVRTVLGWAMENGLVEHNVAAGVSVRDARVQREARLPYADVDLKVIFSSPIYAEGRRPTAKPSI